MADIGTIGQKGIADPRTGLVGKDAGGEPDR